MAVKEINLGPRSRVLEAQEAERADLGERVVAGLKEKHDLADSMLTDEVAYPPLPGPANPGDGVTPLVGCACGKVHIPDRSRSASISMDGVTHRYSLPCYSDASGVRTYLDVKPRIPLEERVANLEKTVADLLLRQPF